MPPPEDPVKIEKLPTTIKTSNTFLDQPTTSTRENEYARLIKKLTKIPEPKKPVPKEAGGGSSDKSKSITISSKGGVSVDPTNMIKSSGIMVEHANIPKPIF
jgi:hypothetical protein